jgi:hypothetical protein
MGDMADAVPLGREPNARTTSVVLRKLEEAEFVRGTMDVEQLEGPAFWEPTTKALDPLPGQPAHETAQALGIGPHRGLRDEPAALAAASRC